MPTPSPAGQRISVAADTTQQITVSGRAQNVLVFPGNVSSATSSSAFVRAKGEGRNVIVEVSAGPADLVVVTQAGQAYVFDLQVNPMIAGQMVQVEDVRVVAGETDTDPVRKSSDYVDGLLEAFTTVIRGEIPRSYQVQPLAKQHYPRWTELQVEDAVEYRGPKYRVTCYVMSNQSKSKYTMRQEEFYNGRQKLIVLDRNVVEPQDQAQVCVVDDTPASAPSAPAAPKITPES